MNRKFIILSLYFFSTICLFSVGFSSWTICMGDKLTASGNIVAEDVITASDYIVIDDSSSLNLKYYKSGFVENYDSSTASGTVTTEGVMSVTYKIIVDNCKTLYKDNTLLRVYTTLDCNGYNLFTPILSTDGEGNEIYLQKVSSNVRGNNVSSINPVINGNTYSVEFVINDLLSDSYTEEFYYFTIDYKFTIDFDYYVENVYAELSNLTFTSSASINGE